MKHPTIFVLTVALLTGCSKPTSSPDTSTPQTASTPTDPSQYPTLIVDREHQIQATNKPATYQIGSSAGIRLDATLFHFNYGTTAVAPNMIQVVLGESQIYKLSRPTVTNLYVIDRTTLEPLRGGPFPGFRSGDHGMLAIGRAMPGTPHKDLPFGVANPRKSLSLVTSAATD